MVSTAIPDAHPDPRRRWHARPPAPSRAGATGTTSGSPSGKAPARRRHPGSRALPGVDVRRLGDVVDAVAAVRPEAVVNAVGIVKQRPAAKEFVPSIEVNALFPHQLARVAAAAGARMVHLSTDCVFSGDKGGYVEADRPDPVDLYGRSKLLGEVTDAPNCLTLRTSIIGLELGNRGGLVEWFLAQRGHGEGLPPRHLQRPHHRRDGPGHRALPGPGPGPLRGVAPVLRSPSTSTRCSRGSLEPAAAPGRGDRPGRRLRLRPQPRLVAPPGAHRLPGAAAGTRCWTSWRTRFVGGRAKA